MIGPKHYEGWTCEGCEYCVKTCHHWCFEPSIRGSLIDNKINDLAHTPNWCPYISDEIFDENGWFRRKIQ